MSTKKLPPGITFRRGRYRVRVQYQGRQHEIGTFRSLTLARLALDKYEAEAVLGTFVSPADQRRELRRQRAELQRQQEELEATKMTVAEWSTIWLQSLDEGLDRRSAGTITSYRSTLRVHILPSLGSKHLVEVTPDDVEATIKAAQSKGAGAAKNTMSTVRAMLNAAVKVKAGGLEASPMPSSLKTLKSRGRADSEIPTQSEIAQIVEIMGDKYGLAVELASWCSLRFGEVLGLQRQDFTNLDKPGAAQLRIDRQWASKTSPPSYQPPKDDSRRTITVPEALVPKIRRHLDKHVLNSPDAPIFTSPRNTARPISHNALASRWNKARDQVHPGLSFHALRHFGLTIYAQAGATVREIMARGGHKDMDAAMRYQHVATDRDRELTAKLSNRLNY